MSIYIDNDKDRAKVKEFIKDTPRGRELDKAPRGRPPKDSKGPSAPHLLTRGSPVKGGGSKSPKR